MWCITNSIHESCLGIEEGVSFENKVTAEIEGIK